MISFGVPQRPTPRERSEHSFTFQILRQTRLPALAWSRALRDPKGENQLWVFGAERTRKSASFNTKNNAQTLPKQLQNNFEKVEKSTFLTPKIVKNDHLKS